MLTPLYGQSNGCADPGHHEDLLGLLARKTMVSPIHFRTFRGADRIPVGKIPTPLDMMPVGGATSLTAHFVQ